MPTRLMQQIQKLSVAERLKLAEDIWDGIEADSEIVRLSSDQKTELERRIKAHRAKPSQSIPWKTVKAELDATFK